MSEPAAALQERPSAPVLRFAPSPNGRLHLGHAYSALLNDRVARDLGGTWLLRIEDIDPVRANPENIAGVMEDLAWLGLSWPEPVRRQSGHMGTYAAASNRLRCAGLIYRCFCSRGDIASAVAERESVLGVPWPRDPDGAPLYPGTCRGLAPELVAARAAAGEPCAWRLDGTAARARVGPVTWRHFALDWSETEVTAWPERWGDPVLVRKDTPTSYHLSVVTDDAAQAISHVVRGLDLEAATDLHAFLAALLGLPKPRYHHHALLAGLDGAKLSKSRNSLSLSSMRLAGIPATAIRADLGFA